MSDNEKYMIPLSLEKIIMILSIHDTINIALCHLRAFQYKEDLIVQD